MWEFLEIFLRLVKLPLFISLSLIAIVFFLDMNLQYGFFKPVNTNAQESTSNQSTHRENQDKQNEGDVSKPIEIEPIETIDHGPQKSHESAAQKSKNPYENQESIQNFTLFSQFLSDSIKEAGLGDIIAHDLPYKISENLRDGKTDPQDLEDLITREFPGSSITDRDMIVNLVKAAVIRISDDNR